MAQTRLRGSRKQYDWCIAAAAFLFIAAQGSPGLASTRQIATYSPPTATLLLIRMLYRPLPAGKAIVTRRSYSVRIVYDGAGYWVEGELVQAAVDAPPSLGALADIERKRPDIGMFLILLDVQGQMVGGGRIQSDGSLGRAAAIAAQSIGGSGLPAIDLL